MTWSAEIPTWVSHVGRQHGQPQTPQRFQSLHGELEGALEVAGVVEAAGADLASHRVAADPSVRGPLAPSRTEEAVVLNPHHRVRAGRPLQHRRVDHVVHVHQIRAQPRQQRIEIGGDFDEAETFAWVSKYFGSILRGPDVAMPDKPAVTLDADRYISLEDNVALPLMQIAFPTVHRFHPDEAPLDVLRYVLGVGETSLLYKNMVSNRLAVQAQANHGCRELSCTFAVIALPNPTAGQTLADLDRIARDSLVELETRGVLNESTERSTVEALSDRLQMLGSTVQLRAGDDATTATVRSLTRNLDETLAIFAEKLLEPKFDPADLPACSNRRCRPSP